MIVKLYTDGGARGNPGPAAIGVVIKNEKDEIIFETSKYVGETTNNEAEYMALLEGLKRCVDKKATKVTSYLDSELVAKQLQGSYKVKHIRMRKHFDTIKGLVQNFENVEFVHVSRNLNKEADSLVNQALDAQEVK